jgi:adenylate cyclase
MSRHWRRRWRRRNGTVALNESSAPCHTLLGSVYLWQKQYDQAISSVERAIALDPNDAWGYTVLAEVLGYLGRSEEAVGAADRALHLKFPGVADGNLIEVGTAYALARRPEEAIPALRQFLSRYPNFLGAHLILAGVYNELGKSAEARAEAAEVLRLNPQFSLEVQRQRMPIKDPAVLERHLADLRKAGLK